jgi:hypothetical protein
MFERYTERAPGTVRVVVIVTRPHDIGEQRFLEGAPVGCPCAPARGRGHRCPFTLGVLTREADPEALVGFLDSAARTDFAAATSALEMVTVIRTLHGLDPADASGSK